MQKMTCAKSNASFVINDTQAVSTILNSLDALVYVADMQTYELLFLNNYGVSVWGEPAGRKCYEVLQKDQQSPCSFCSNAKLLNADGQPTEPYVWEFQNTQNLRWYQCRDQAVMWSDARLVRIEIATDITERKLMEEELILTKALAEKAALTDVLTLLNNRRAFFKFSEEALLQALSASQPVSIIMFDLDNFKGLNDRRGHAAGDAALIALSKKAAQMIRHSDILARLGGEEFAIFLPDTDAQQAHVVAEKMRRAFADLQIENDRDIFSCTASFGVASLYLCEHSEALCADKLIYELLNQADQLLLSAKKLGKNRVGLELRTVP